MATFYSSSGKRVIEDYEEDLEEENQDETKEEKMEITNCEVKDNIKYFQIGRGNVWKKEEELEPRVTKKWLRDNPDKARKCRRNNRSVVEKKLELPETRVKTLLKKSVLYEDDPEVFKVDYIEDCKVAKKKKDTREYLVKWAGSDEKTWQKENDVDSCMIVDWYKEHKDKVKQCKVETLEMYNANKKATNPKKIKANNMVIWAIQDAITKTFIPQGKEIDLLILDGEDFNTTFRLLNEIKPHGAIDSITVPNPNSSYVMRQLYCGNDELVQKVNLYNHSLGEYFASLSEGEVQYAGAWLDFTQTYLGEKTDKYPPKSDLEQVFKKQLLADQSVLAVTLYWSRGFEYRLDMTLKEIPTFAIKYDYELEPMCDLEHTYKCDKIKLASNYSYDQVALMIYKVHKLTQDDEQKEEEEEE
jgi:hypothetical protein